MHYYSVNQNKRRCFPLKKLFPIFIAVLMFFSGCSESAEEKADFCPTVFYNGNFYCETDRINSSAEGFEFLGIIEKQILPDEPMTGGKIVSNFLPSGTEIYGNPDFPQRLFIKTDENKFVTYALSLSFSKPSSETEVKSESSRYENPYASCVPESEPNSKKDYGEPSVSHSTDTSSDVSSSENVQHIKGSVVKRLPEYSDLPNAALGNGSALERWNLAICDLSEISEIRLQYEFAQERSLSFDETSAILEELHYISPKMNPETDIPSDKESYTVAAFDSGENELWRVTLNGNRFIVSFGKENASYVFGMEKLYSSAIISTAVFCYSSSQP